MFDACNIYLHQAWTDANGKITVQDYMQLILLSTVVDPSKKMPDVNCEVQDLLLEVVDLKHEVPASDRPSVRQSAAAAAASLRRALPTGR